MPAAFSRVGSRNADVHDPALVDVVDGTDERTVGEFDDHRADVKVQEDAAVRCI
jgi:hypothetical protein